MEEKTSIAKYVGSTSSKKTGLNYKLEFSNLRDMINSQIDYTKEQESQRKNCVVDSYEKKKNKSRESENKVESRNEDGEVVKIEMESQEEEEGQSSEINEKSKVSLYENEIEVDGALARINNSFTSFAISFLQDFEDLVHKDKPIVIPYNPGTENQVVDEANEPYQSLNILLLPEVDFVILEEIKEFQRHWKEFICRG